MTYGDNTGEIRDSLTILLGWHRVIQRLGGPGNPKAKTWTTQAERERMGQIVQRYRLATLTWCRAAVTAVTPKTDLSTSSKTTRNPTEELRHRLTTTLKAAGHGESLLDLLAMRHGNELIDTWQRAGRAAALGEHDLTTDVNLEHLTPGQAQAVLKDASDVTTALVLLDTRYKNIPGWRRLKDPQSLEHAAQACSQLTARSRLDHGVDHRGWRPVAGVIDGPALPGIAGVVQAQHNLFVDLARVPNALNLRRVLLSQAKLSQTAAKHAQAAAPDLAATFGDRAQLYVDLVRASRDLGGLAGDGNYAVVQSQNAVTRLDRTPTASSTEGPALGELARLCARTDARIAATIEHGFNERLYLAPVNHPRLSDEHIRGIHPTRHRWVPTKSPDQFPLLLLVREELRPAPPLIPQPSDARESRASFDAAHIQQSTRSTHAHQAR